MLTPFVPNCSYDSLDKRIWVLQLVLEPLQTPIVEEAETKITLQMWQQKQHLKKPAAIKVGLENWKVD